MCRLGLVLVAVAAVAVQGGPHHKQIPHTHKHHDLEEAINVKCKDTNKLPGVVSEVEWVGNPSTEYNIYAGTFSDQASWKLLESHLLLQNHPSTEPAPETTIRKTFKLASGAKEVIVCETESVEAAPQTQSAMAPGRKGEPAPTTGGAKCGSAQIFDEYDTNTWWNAPNTVRIPFLHSGELHTGGAFAQACVTAKQFRGILHTTESTGYSPSNSEYYGHTSAPHFTVHFDAHTKVATTYQHLPVDVAARALRNEDGGVETNQQCAIQIEIATKAATSSQMPAEQKAALKALIAWISQQKGIPLESAQYFDDKTVKRFDNEYWNTFAGWCGHQHVPENTHWDPGLIGAGPTSGSDFATSTMFTDYGLKITKCHDGTKWGACTWSTSLEEEE
jgi:hypothetical protein